MSGKPAQELCVRSQHSQTIAAVTQDSELWGDEPGGYDSQEVGTYV